MRHLSIQYIMCIEKTGPSTRSLCSHRKASYKGPQNMASENNSDRKTNSPSLNFIEKRETLMNLIKKRQPLTNRLMTKNRCKPMQSSNIIC